MPDTLSLHLDLTVEEYGALLAAVARAVETVPPGSEQALLSALDDRLRDAQRQVLGPMHAVEGLRLTRAIQASERSVAQALSRG